MKTFESEFPLNYSQAIQNCREMGYEIAQPINPIDSQTLTLAMKNLSTNSSTKGFWIGKLYNTFSFKNLTFCFCLEVFLKVELDLEIFISTTVM